jgi:hypothetical protein
VSLSAHDVTILNLVCLYWCSLYLSGVKSMRAVALKSDTFSNYIQKSSIGGIVKWNNITGS